MKLFLRKSDNLIIEDPKDVKTLEDIKTEFGDGKYIEDYIDFKDEYYNVVNGKINKINRAEREAELKIIEEQKEAKRKTERQIRKAKLKKKLNLTDEQLEALTEAIKEGI